MWFKPKKVDSEKIILEDIGVKLSVPQGTNMLHVNFDAMGEFEDGYSKNRLRQVYRRTDRVVDGYVVFSHSQQEDR